MTSLRIALSAKEKRGEEMGVVFFDCATRREMQFSSTLFSSYSIISTFLCIKQLYIVVEEEEEEEEGTPIFLFLFFLIVFSFLLYGAPSAAAAAAASSSSSVYSCGGVVF